MQQLSATAIASLELIKPLLQNLSGLEEKNYQVLPSSYLSGLFGLEKTGWLELTKKGDEYSLMWTTAKTSHWPYGKYGPCLAVTFKADGDLLLYFESAITMWVKWGMGRGTDKELHKAVEYVKWAHRKLITPDNE